jgi:hypothetical protein
MAIIGDQDIALSAEVSKTITQSKFDTYCFQVSVNDWRRQRVQVKQAQSYITNLSSVSMTIHAQEEPCRRLPAAACQRRG